MIGSADSAGFLRRDAFRDKTDLGFPRISAVLRLVFENAPAIAGVYVRVSRYHKQWKRSRSTLPSYEQAFARYSTDYCANVSSGGLGFSSRRVGDPVFGFGFCRRSIDSVSVKCRPRRSRSCSSVVCTRACRCACTFDPVHPAHEVTGGVCADPAVALARESA